MRTTIRHSKERNRSIITEWIKMWTVIGAVSFVFILNYLFKMGGTVIFSFTAFKSTTCLLSVDFWQKQIAFPSFFTLLKIIGYSLDACVALWRFCKLKSHEQSRANEQGWTANERPKSAKIIVQSPRWMIHMKFICGRANVQCASISQRGELGSRQSLVNDEVLIGFQCLRVPLGPQWSVCTES